MTTFADVPHKQTYIIWAIALILSIILINKTIKVIEGGYQGVVISLGTIAPQPLGEGLHFVWPFITDVKEISNRIVQTVLTTDAASKDLQTLQLNAVVTWRILPSKVTSIYRKYGDLNDLQFNLITPYALSILKSESTSLTAENLLQNRIIYEQNITKELQGRLLSEGIQVQSVNISQFTFSKEFDQAIEDKQVAQQQAQKAFYLAEKSKNEAQALREQAKGEADAQIERARGQSQAQTMMAKTLDPQILSQQWIEKWNGQLPNVVSGSSQQFMMNLPADGFMLNKK